MIRFVLLRPRSPENIGAVARALRNLGFEDWAIAELGTHDFAAARRVAVHAEDLLDRPRVSRTLDEAVADCAWVVGTSSRRIRGKRRLSPQEVAREALRLSGRGGRTALVFGDERGGLTNAEVHRCHDLSAIPAAEAQPSLNLAQAVLVYAWEVRRAASASAVAPSVSRARPATDAELARIEESLRAALRAGGFLAGPERHAVRDLFATIRRARPSEREARLWIAALSTLARRR